MSRQRELETALYVQWCQISGFATARGLHVIPFEEWLVKQSIDGDSQADELLGLRQEFWKQIDKQYRQVHAGSTTTQVPVSYQSGCPTKWWRQYKQPAERPRHQTINYATQGAAAEMSFSRPNASITRENYPAFRKAFKQALKDRHETFTFEGAEVLTAYAKIVVEFYQVMKW